MPRWVEGLTYPRAGELGLQWVTPLNHSPQNRDEQGRSPTVSNSGVVRFCSTKCCHAAPHAGLVLELAASSWRMRVRDPVAASHGEYSTACRMPSALRSGVNFIAA